jgi:hypothetical protein
MLIVIYVIVWVNVRNDPAKRRKKERKKRVRRKILGLSQPYSVLSFVYFNPTGTNDGQKRMIFAVCEVWMYPGFHLIFWQLFLIYEVLSTRDVPWIFLLILDL